MSVIAKLTYPTTTDKVSNSNLNWEPQTDFKRQTNLKES